MKKFFDGACRCECHVALGHWLVCTLLFAVAVSPAIAQGTQNTNVAPVRLDTVRCGTLTSSYGPYDYRTDKDKLEIVERAHFTPAIANLIKVEGSTSSVDGDLHYTLSTFPNHHRALDAMLRLADRMKIAKGNYMRWDFECYPLRAISFRPDDAIPRMLYALYLNRNRRQAEAVAQLEATIPVAGDSPLTNYNLGLTFFDCGDYKNALAQAHRALALGVPRTELRDKLRRVGRWTEPSAAPELPMAEPAASAPDQ